MKQKEFMDDHKVCSLNTPHTNTRIDIIHDVDILVKRIELLQIFTPECFLYVFKFPLMFREASDN